MFSKLLMQFFTTVLSQNSLYNGRSKMFRLKVLLWKGMGFPVFMVLGLLRQLDYSKKGYFGEV